MLVYTKNSFPTTGALEASPLVYVNVGDSSSSAQEGSQERIEGQQHSLRSAEDEEVVYDRPIISQGIGSNDIKLEGVDPSTIFDDPGYTEGMMMHKNQPQNLSEDDHQPSNDLSLQQLVPLKQATAVAHSEGSENGSGTVEVVQTLSVQMSQAPAMKSSINSLSLLNFDEDELGNFDPVVASYFRTQTLSDTDDEIAISEV